ncbi:MAG: TrpR-like protein, YerC/YecD [Clostridiales bacterium]|nr:TrpR-like protein, YerC/YecD [Clostridiales bacterium]
MISKLKDPKMDELFKAILSLKTIEECYCFFDDLCTVSELKAMEQRFQVAKMLSQGRVYSEIAVETGASSATISRVNRALLYGSDGYKTVLSRLEK